MMFLTFLTKFALNAYGIAIFLLYFTVINGTPDAVLPLAFCAVALVAILATAAFVTLSLRAAK